MTAVVVVAVPLHHAQPGDREAVAGSERGRRQRHGDPGRRAGGAKGAAGGGAGSRCGWRRRPASWPASRRAVGVVP